MGYFINYEGDATGNGPSRGLWGDCPLDSHDEVHVFFDDFTNTGDQASTTIVGGWESYIDTGCSAVVTDDAANGIMKLTCDATGNDEEVAIQLGSDHAPFAVISTAGSQKALWYETRVAFTATTNQQAYIGLADGGVPGDSLLADAGTGINDKDFIGFRLLEADSDGLDAVYRTTSTEVVHQDAAQVVVASTYYKIGFKYMMDSDRNWRLHYYVDGVEQSSGVLATATSVPDGVYMAPLFAIKQHEAAEKAMNIDWVKVAMAR